MNPLQQASAKPSVDKTLGMVSQAAGSSVQPQPSGQGGTQPVAQGSVAGEYVGDDLPGSEQASPEEQMDYEKTVTAGQKLLFDEKMNKSFLDMLEAQAEDPAKAIADVAVSVISTLDEQSGGTIPEAVILPAGAAMVEEVAEMAKQHPGLFDVDQNVLGKAGQMMVSGLAEEYGVNPEEVKGLLESIPQDQLQSIGQEQSQYG